MEIQVVGKYNIGKGSFVTVKLFLVPGFLYTVKIIIADIVGFNKTNRHVSFGKNIIGCAAALTLRFVRSSYIRHQAFNQLLQVPTKSMFSCISLFVSIAYALNVVWYRHL